MNNLIIRDAKHSDLDQVYRLGVNVAEFETSRNVVTFWPREILKNLVAKNDVLFKIAEIGGEIVGFMILNLNLSLKKGELENMFVEPDFREKGIGKELLREIIAEAKNRGVEFIVGLENEATEFLLKNGFAKGKTFTWLDLVLDNKFNKKGDVSRNQ